MSGMSNNPTWKSDKACHECKVQHRKEIVKEIKEACGKCPKLRNIETPKHMRKMKD